MTLTNRSALFSLGLAAVLVVGLMTPRDGLAAPDSLGADLPFAAAPDTLGADLPAAPDPTSLTVEGLSIDDALRDAEWSARQWHIAWTTIFAAGLCARVGLGIGLENEDLRIAQWVGAVPVAAGLLSQVLMPLPALGLEDDLRNATSTEARLALLHRYAAAERKRRGWLQHVLGIGINVAAASYLLFARDDELGAALQLGIGTTVTEMRIWTAPTAATHALERRASGTLVDSTRARPSPLVAAVGPGSVLLGWNF